MKNHVRRYVSPLFLVAVLVLGASWVAADPSEHWREVPNGKGVEFKPTSWTDNVSAVPKEQLYQYDQLAGRSLSASGPEVTKTHDVAVSRGISQFSILGNVTQRRSMEWTCDAGGLDAREFAYFEITYLAGGLARDYSALAYVNFDAGGLDAREFAHFETSYLAGGLARDYSAVAYVTLSGHDAAGKSVEVPLLDSSQVVNDGGTHTMFWRKKLDLTVDSVKVRMSTDRSSAKFSLNDLRLYREMPKSSSGLPRGGLTHILQWDKGLQSLDLTSLFNANRAAALERVLSQSSVVDGFGGIPFYLKLNGDNIIHPAETTSWRKRTVDFMGEKIPLSDWSPVQRDDQIIISVGRKVREAFLTLLCEFPVVRPIYSLPSLPYSISDIEGFAIELRYADGDNDLVFPYSIGDRGFMLRRTEGAYAVPVDPSRALNAIVVKNRTYGVNVSVEAVTVNQGPKRLFSRVWDEPKVVRVPDRPRPRKIAPHVSIAQGKVVAANTFYRVVMDRRAGFSIQKCENLWSPGTPFVFDASSGLEVQIGDRVLTGRSFRVEKVTVGSNARTALILLRGMDPSVPLRLALTIRVDDSPELKMSIAATNYGSAPLKADIRFPVLKSLSVGTKGDTWYFFPKYRNVISNEQGYCRHLSDRGFPMQFFDVYNPREGCGVAFLTHNLQQMPVEYSVSKYSKGVTGYVGFPGEFFPLKPGSTMRFAETSLGFHKGDWHGGMGIYQKWLATWYRPVHAQDKQWVINSFAYTGALISPQYCRAILRIPGIVDPVTGKYHVDEYVAKDREFYNGILPDFGIFGCWAYDEEHNVQREGEYGKKDYDHAGGLENIRDAISRFDRYSIPYGPYTISDRYNKDTEFAKEYGLAAAMQRKDGWIANDQYQWFPCKGGKLWREHIVKAIAGVVKDWGSKLVYLDVFGSRADDPCYRGSHGHEVPSWNNKWDGEYLKELRALLPNTAFLSEYPVTDVNCQYHDGWIVYDSLSLNQVFGRLYDDPEQAPMYAELPAHVMRFVFPRIKAFCFPVGSEHEDWSPRKYVFFNGQGVSPSPYWLHTSDARALINKSVRLERRYVDCFTSSNPVPLVPTEREGVYGNKWPGKGRTLWTLYNTRYTTVRGPVLVVDHKPGDTYYDAWNGRQINFKVVNGRAIINLKLYPMGLGCLVQTHRPAERMRRP